MKTVAFCLLGLGLILLLASGLWSTLSVGTSAWTAEKSERSAKVKDRLTNLSFILNRPVSMHRGTDLGVLKAEYEQLQKENEQLNTEFNAAYDRPRNASKLLKWSGISLALVGIVGWYAANKDR